MKQTINIEDLIKANEEDFFRNPWVGELCDTIQKLKTEGDWIRLASARIVVPNQVIGSIARLTKVKTQLYDTETHWEHSLWIRSGETEYEIYCVVPINKR